MTSIKEKAIAFVKDYFAKNGDENTKAVIGISGGKDSSTVAALCCAALGKDRVIGVMMPNGVQSDIEDSKRLCEFLQIEHYTINIESYFNAIKSEISSVLNLSETTSQFNTNTPARLRMATLYSVAALKGNCRVSNNGNLSECLAGFFTIWGDGAGDFAPLSHLFVDEVVELGRQLGLPEDLITKAPSDGMSGKTDEENLGFTYDELKKVALGDFSNLDSCKISTIQDRINKMAFKKDLLNIPSF